MNLILQGDAGTRLKELPDESVDLCVTSPPYYQLRDYGAEGQIGLEDTVEEYIEQLVGVFEEVHRVLKKDGNLYINIGDSYAGGAGRWGGMENMSEKQRSNFGSQGQIPKARPWKHEVIKRKELIGIPWRLAFALQAKGWYLREDIIWAKPNPMPESVKDRCTKSHEYIFHFTKEPTYYYDAEAISETSGRSGHRHNKRDVWMVTAKPCKEAHFATFPLELIEPCILAGSPRDGVVLDPFAGSGTVGVAATQNGRGYVLIELNPEYIGIIKKRLAAVQIKL